MSDHDKILSQYDPWAWRSDMNTPQQSGAQPELRQFEPAWYDRAPTNAAGAYNALARQLPTGVSQRMGNAESPAGMEWMRKLFGVENPLNMLGQGHQGYDTAARGYEAGDPGTMGAGALQMAMALPFGIGAKGPAANALKAEGQGIRAYHGSPHDFERFDTSKIGTGEGAQAYGHGLYFAENEGVARGYKKRLEGKGWDVGYDAPHIDGKPIQSPAAITASVYLEQVDGNVEQAIRKLRLQAHLERLDPALPNDPTYTADAIRSYENAADFLNDMRGRGQTMTFQKVAPGKMYEVNINANPEHFLDWDKPLSGQREEAKAVLGPYVDALYAAREKQRQEVFDSLVRKGSRANAERYMGTPAIRDDLELMRSAINGDKGKQVSTALRDVGIPGVRYKDAGSRGTEGGTNNHVVFDDRLIEILRKYGLVGMVAGGGLGASQPADAKQEIDRVFSGYERQ